MPCWAHKIHRKKKKRRKNLWRWCEISLNVGCWEYKLQWQCFIVCDSQKEQAVDTSRVMKFLDSGCCKHSRGRRYPELCGCGIFENWNFRHSLVIRTSFSSLICIPNVNYAETHRRLSFSLRSQTIQRRNWLSQKLFTFALMSSKVSSCYSI